LIVVDSNVVCYLYLAGEFSDAASAVLARDSDWVAPAFWRSELCNVLVTYVRQGTLALEDALIILRLATARVVAVEPDFALVLGLASDAGCSAYDGQFVALARQLSVPLVTFDRQLLAQFPDTAVSPERFVAW
jgi:predicted nucleic acid-binding protein